MDFLKKNKKIAILAALTVALTVVGFVLINWTGTSLAQTDADLQATRAQIEPLIAPGLLYPDQKNIKAVKANALEIDSLTSSLLSEYNNPDIVTGVTEPIVFKNQANDFANEMDRLYRTAKIKIPADYGFSFEMYRNILPDSQNTGLLNTQISVLNLVLRKLAESGITDLKSIQRVNFANESGGGGGTTGAKLSDLRVTTHEAKGYREIPFTLNFSGDIVSLQKLLNFLALSKNVFVVKSLQVKNENITVYTVESALNEHTVKKYTGPFIVFGNKYRFDIQITFVLIEFIKPPAPGPKTNPQNPNTP
ncbi:MAG: Amuc_1100 family pilus-like protein [Verrucomicrobiae bacterium]|nr:Amuc_1100 family pilus-like protein [Verrucomicrobiae bacterium]